MPDAPDLPFPRPWPEPITLEQYVAFAPNQLEVVQGYLFDGPESPEARVDLLALLLTNCGLAAAVRLASPEDWREALDRTYPDW